MNLKLCLTMSVGALCMMVGCHSAPPIQSSQFNARPVNSASTAVPATQASAIVSDPNGRVVRRLWAQSVAPYPSGGVYAYPTFFQTADAQLNRPAWQQPFAEPALFIYDFITYPYHALRTSPRSEVEYRGPAFNGADAGPGPR